MKQYGFYFLVLCFLYISPYVALAGGGDSNINIQLASLSSVSANVCGKEDKNYYYYLDKSRNICVRVRKQNLEYACPQDTEKFLYIYDAFQDACLKRPKRNGTSN